MVAPVFAIILLSLFHREPFSRRQTGSEDTQEISAPSRVVLSDVRRGRRSHSSSPEPERTSDCTGYLVHDLDFLRLKDIPSQAHPQPLRKARKGRSGYTL